MSSISIGSSFPRAERAHTTPFWKRQVMILSRWLHIYLSMASFGILFFFAVTGLTLNHAEWFSSQQRTVQLKGSMDARLLASNPDKLGIVEYLRNTHGIHGAVKDFRMEDTDASIS